MGLKPGDSFCDECNQVVFPDENLEAAVREELEKPKGALTKVVLNRLVRLSETDEHELGQIDGAIHKGVPIHIDGAGLEHAQNLRELYIGVYMRDRMTDLSFLTSLTKLEKFGLEYSPEDPDDHQPHQDITPLGSLKNLTWLHLDSWISDLRPLASLINLTELVLITNLLYLPGGRRINDLSPLAPLTKLTTLDLPLAGNHISDLSPLASLTNLTSLDLDLNNNQISDVSPLGSLTKLTTLHLGNDIRFRDEPRLPWQNQISDVSPLGSLTNLTELDLSRNQISDVGPLGSLTNLTSLILTGNQISDVGPLGSLTNLTELGLHDNEISDVSPLESLTNLTELGLHDNEISDVSPLASLTNLTSLIISANKISDVSPLASLTNLTSLIITGNQISDVSPLASLTNLTKLHLWQNQITDVGPLFDNPDHCSACQRELGKDDDFCDDCGEERDATAGSFPNLTKLRLDVDKLIDKSPLASLPNLKTLNDNPFVREDFISAEPGESSEDSEGAESKESFRDAETLDWEILPPGWWKIPREVSAIKSQFKGTEKEFREFMERPEFVDSYGPIKTVKTKFSGQGYQYFVFLFRNHAVAECPQYGNAAYVLKGTDGWQDIFRRSRQELRKNYKGRVHRIFHTGGWKERLGKYLN